MLLTSRTLWFRNVLEKTVLKRKLVNSHAHYRQMVVFVPIIRGLSHFTGHPAPPQRDKAYHRASDHLQIKNPNDCMSAQNQREIRLS